MAITPKDNEAFYREVDEELRKEQLSSWWSRYGSAAIAGVVLLLAAIGGFLWWQHQQAREAGQHGEVLLEVLRDAQEGRTKEAAPKLEELAKEGDAGYRAAALLTKGALAAQENNADAAAAAFKSVAEDEAIPDPFRNAALIRQTAMEFDKLEPAEVVRRLQPLAQPGNPWFGSAGEMVAVAHLKAGRPQQAAPIFAALAKDEGLPQSIRSRAVQMAGALGVDAVNETPASGAAKE